MDVPQETVDENTNPDISISNAKNISYIFLVCINTLFLFHFVCGHGQVSLEDGGDGKLDLCFLENQQSVVWKKSVFVCWLRFLKMFSSSSVNIACRYLDT